jgi:multicomponent Na+:H+ antiporter subunit B
VSGFPIEVVLFTFLVCLGVVIARLRDLLAAAMLTGMFSLISACLFTLMDAVDVAFTEAAVGAGISTVLLLSTLALTDLTEKLKPRRWLPLIVVLITGAALIYGTLDMPAYGDPGAPIHSYLAQDFIEGTRDEFGIPNIVTAILGSYRGYDTFGETTVIFTASVGVLLLLVPMWSVQAPAVDEAELFEGEIPQRMRDKAIVREVSKALIPFILLFALYVQFHGDYGPGGGFQAGVIFAAGLILYGIIFGLDRLKAAVPPLLVETGLALGVLLYGGVGVWSMVEGGTFLDYHVLDHHDPQHGLHLGLLLIEAGVGLTVSSAMTAIFYAFAGRRGRT